MLAAARSCPARSEACHHDKRFIGALIVQCAGKHNLNSALPPASGSIKTVHRCRPDAQFLLDGRCRHGTLQHGRQQGQATMHCSPSRRASSRVALAMSPCMRSLRSSCVLALASALLSAICSSARTRPHACSFDIAVGSHQDLSDTRARLDFQGWTQELSDTADKSRWQLLPACWLACCG